MRWFCGARGRGMVKKFATDSKIRRSRAEAEPQLKRRRGYMCVLLDCYIYCTARVKCLDVGRNKREILRLCCAAKAHPVGDFRRQSVATGNRKARFPERKPSRCFAQNDRSGRGRKKGLRSGSVR